MCKLILLVVGVLFLYQVEATENRGEKKTKKPNIVIIYGDDVGYGDVGVYGAKLIPTPNIDRCLVWKYA